MQNYYGGSWDSSVQNHQSFAPSQATVNSFIRRVFLIMTCGLGITGATAWGLRDYFINNPLALEGLGGLYWVIAFLPLVFVLIFSFGFERLTFLSASILFGVYSAVMGGWLSFILLRYSGASIASTFFITAGTFAVMALIGFTTKINLAKFGSVLLMVLVGMIIASIVNMFLASGPLYWIISGVGVLVFAGLTAYDTQRLVEMSAMEEHDADFAGKASVIGALSLYLNFINLFLFLLRFTGGSRND